LRKFLAVPLAVPTVALVYGAAFIHRLGLRRLLVALLVLGTAGAVATTAFRPASVTGKAPTSGVQVPASEFSAQIQTGELPKAAISISFPSPMNPASVEAMLSVEPATPIELAWDPTDTLLTVTPRFAWAPATFHTITIEAGALAADGSPLDHRLRAAFLTRPAVVATITADDAVGGLARLDSGFRIAFDGPVDAATIHLVLDPAMDGSMAPAADSTPDAPVFEFRPSGPLTPGQAYIARLAPGGVDADGGAISSAGATITTAPAPTIVRFRPGNRASGVGWSQDLSVRFTQPMDHASTQAAWTAVQGGKKIAGTFSWAEHDTVLVFNPTAVLGYSQKVVIGVGAGAMSAAGVPLSAPQSATFTTAARSVSTSTGGGGGGTVGGGGSIGSSTWAAVESYYLKLMNCTRTGGWVSSSGSCSGAGTRNVAPLWQDAGITSKVTRPYAKKLAVNNLCTHFSGGTPGDRLAAAGYTSWNWAENIGCLSGDPYWAVLSTHLYFQNEKSTNGGHYVNLMNALYDRVGIGVWVASGRVRLVIDFYKPL
jgi:uncharacterized protein YkwD